MRHFQTLTSEAAIVPSRPKPDTHSGEANDRYERGFRSFLKAGVGLVQYFAAASRWCGSCSGCGLGRHQTTKPQAAAAVRVSIFLPLFRWSSISAAAPIMRP